MKSKKDLCSVCNKHDNGNCKDDRVLYLGGQRVKHCGYFKANYKAVKMLILSVQSKLFYAKLRGEEIQNMRQLAEKYGIKYDGLRKALSPKPRVKLTGNALKAMLDFVGGE